MAERLLIHRLCAFRFAYPAIKLDLLTTTGLVDLAAREADIAVRLTDKPPDYLVGREVLSMRHGVYGSPAYFEREDETPKVVLFRSNGEMPEWVLGEGSNYYLHGGDSTAGNLRGK